MQLVRHLNHENIVQIKDIIPPTNKAAFNDMYVVYELMDTDLHQIIRSPQPLSDDHTQYFLYQVLWATAHWCCAPCMYCVGTAYRTFGDWIVRAL